MIQDRWAPLHFAVDGGYTEVATLLISKGADVNSMNEVSISTYI